jgi:hypothetical protein
MTNREDMGPAAHVDKEEGNNTDSYSIEDDVSPRPLAEWTKIHAHYALMGGFAFSTHRSEINILPEDITRAVLTTQGLLHIIKYFPDLIPDISEEAIEDKSKASALAKTLVCLQATWFVVETIGRLATSYPISLLEMNTLVHALCCLAVYIAWWDKPLDIEESTLIPCDNTRTESLCARMVEKSDLGKLHKPTKLVVLPKFLADPLPRTFEGVLVKAAQDPDETTNGIEPPNSFEDSRRSVYTWLHIRAPKLNAKNQIYGPHHYYRENPTYVRYKSLAKLHGENNQQYLPYECVVTSVPDLPLPSEPFTWSYAMTRITSFMQSCWDEVFYQWLYSFIHFNLSLQRPQVLFWLGAMAGGAFYGGLHLLAWHGPFNTRAQQILWRISGLILVGPLPIILFVMLLVVVRHTYKKVARPFHRFPEEIFEIPIHEEDYRDYARHRMERTPMKTWGHWIGGPVVKLCVRVYAVVYFVARIYIVIESIINLAYLPDGVYKTPEWSNYMPHMGAS